MDNRFVIEPKDLVGAVLTSLGDGCVNSYVHSSCEEGIRYEIRFLGNTSPAFSDSIDLSLIGPYDQDDEVAHRAALLCTIAAFRDEYGILVGDYSYSKIAASHKLFISANCRLNKVHSDFRKAKNAALSFLRSLNEFMIGAQAVPALLQVYQNKRSVMAAEGRAMMAKVKEANKAVEDMMKLQNVANDPVSFFKAIGNEIEMSEEESFFLVQEIFKQVMSVQFGVVPRISTTRKGDGLLFQSSVVLPDGGTVVGDEREEEFSASVVCMIKSLRVVETKSNKQIQDLTFGMWEVMNQSILSFEDKCQSLALECGKICAATSHCVEVLTAEFADVQLSGPVVAGIPVIATALSDVIERLDVRKKQVEQATANLQAKLCGIDDLREAPIF